PPGNVAVSGVMAAEDCDVEPLPSLSEPVVITFDPVVTAHPDLGADGPVLIDRYELVLEREEPTLLIFRVDLPSDVTSFEVPADFTAFGDEFKFEILAIADDGNRTAIESCFEIDRS
ncbi:MAG: hypothetical protein R3349_10915, partial [Geminicoccaceae bacterium]|nr:hypothetical protein [Geminicoccaceae bacterium]